MVDFDTRNKYILFDFKEFSVDNEYIDEKYIIDDNNVLNFLQYISQLIIRHKLLIVSFNVDNCNNWLTKYIRLYKLNDNKFVVCNRNSKPIEWRKLNDETILKNDFE